MTATASEPTTDEIAAGEFVPVEVAAQRLGITGRAVRYMMDRGELRYVRATGDGKKRCARRVSRVSLDYWIKRNLVTE